jgi:hypothetical protein
MRLSRIKASGVRGIPSGWPTLAIGERGLVLYGPNGTGKTSFIDAIEYLLTRRSSLFDENRQGVNWAVGKQHIRATQVDAALTVTNGANSWELKFDSAPAQPLVAWCEVASRSSFLLRRYMLLRFIEAAPKGRYEQLEPFLNLGDFIEFEERLSSIKSSIDTACSLLRADVASSNRTFQASFDLAKDEPVTLANILKKINVKLHSIGVERCTDEPSCKVASIIVREMLESEKPTEKYLSLMRLKHSVQQMSSGRIYVDLMGQYSAALYAFEEEFRREKKLVVAEILEHAKELISNNALTECPICERPIDPIALADRLQQRINDNVRFATLREDASRKRQALLQPINLLHTSLVTLIAAWDRDMPDPIPRKFLEESAVLLEITEALKANITSEQARSFEEHLREAPENRDELIVLIDRIANAETQGLVRLAVSEASAMLSNLDKLWDSHRRKLSSLEVLDGEWRIAEAVHSHAVASRKGVVQELLDSIASVANSMYEAIHPEEKIATSRLMVRPTEEGSVNLQTEFYGKVAPPRLHYSESHLDTLGLCYFLALRKTEAVVDGSFRLLLLDDVLHSVDADHRVRVAQLLTREFSDHQLVITTHDDIFFERLRASLNTNGMEYQRFHGWDIVKGPAVGSKTSDIELVCDEDLRMGAPPPELSAACGRAFEWMLRNLTENLQVAIPARFNRGHDIGSMWPPLFKKLKQMKAFADARPNLSDDIDLHAWVRNAIGAHYNVTSSPPTPSETRDFASLLAILYEMTYCRACNDFIAKTNQDIWECRGRCLAYSTQRQRDAGPTIVSAAS